ncbi:hypothetical protein LINGRAHAP2_LOCUS5785 [Linum grandiflorum]
MEEELGSVWSLESTEELRQSLLYKTMELESVKSEATEKLNKCKEDINKLISMVTVAYQERDEARDNLQTLLNKIYPIAAAPPGSPIVLTRANSSITESNSLSDNNNNNNNNNTNNYSSPVDSFFQDVASAPAAAAAKYDPFDAIVENLVKGKALPQQGKLLEAVMAAGPLLNTLIVAGPLPRWRNPPKVQTFKIPPVSIKGCDANLSCSSSAAAAVSMLDFGNVGGGGCGGSGPGFESGGWNHVPAGKRKRFH